MWLALVASAFGQNVFTGPEVVDAVASSVEVNDSLLQVLQAQARYHKHLSYLTTTTRWSPGQYEFDDGTLMQGNLIRALGGGAVGLGNPEKGGAHFGILLDGIAETGVPGFSYGGYQEVMYFGVGYKGFQFTVNGRVDFLAGGTGTQSLDPWREFRAEATPDVYRAALPFDNDLPNTHGKGVSLYHGPTGAFAMLTYDDNTILDAQIHVQPLVALLPESLGLPAAGLRFLDDRAKQPPDAFDVLEPPKKRFQSDLGTDDAFGIGGRTKFIVEWLPVPAFRYAELGLVKPIGELGEKIPLGFGVRAAVVHPEGPSYRGAVESFGMIGARGGHVALAYAYNVPDGTTFLPIPNAHVFGIQAVLGRAEASKPIVPIVRGFADEK